MWGLYYGDTRHDPRRLWYQIEGPRCALGLVNGGRTGPQVIRIRVAEVDKLVLNRLRDLGAFDDRVNRILRGEHFVHVTAVDSGFLGNNQMTSEEWQSTYDVGFERRLDLLGQQFLEIDYIASAQRTLDR